MTPLRYRTLTPDRGRTGLRRSEPSSRTVLMGEQPNPSRLLQQEDTVSRHRCYVFSNYLEYQTIPSSSCPFIVSNNEGVGVSVLALANRELYPPIGG